MLLLWSCHLLRLYSTSENQFLSVTFAFAAALLRLYRASGKAGWRIFSNSWMQEDKVIYEFGICKIFGRKNLSHLPELLDASAQIRRLRNISYFLIHFDLPGHERFLAENQWMYPVVRECINQKAWENCSGRLETSFKEEKGEDCFLFDMQSLLQKQVDFLNSRVILPVLPGWRNGRRIRLKIWNQKWCAGSSPAPGTPGTDVSNNI